MRALLIAAATTLLLAACNGETQTPSTSDGESGLTSATPSAPAPSPTEDPYAPNVGDRALEVGETREGRGVTTRVVKVRFPYPSAPYREPEPNVRWLGVKLRVCVREGASGPATTPGSLDFSVVDKLGNNYGNSSHWTNYPQPTFPEYQAISPGQCRQGWLLVDVPKGVDADRLSYSAEGVNIAEWLL